MLSMQAIKNILTPKFFSYYHIRLSHSELKYPAWYALNNSVPLSVSLSNQLHIQFRCREALHRAGLIERK